MCKCYLRLAEVFCTWNTIRKVFCVLYFQNDVISISKTYFEYKISKVFCMYNSIQCVFATVLKVVQERRLVSPAIRGRVPLPRIFLIYFWSENGEFWCIIGGILCDLKLQESKQETRYRPNKSKGAGSPTLATRPHFKPWFANSVDVVIGERCRLVERDALPSGDATRLSVGAHVSTQSLQRTARLRRHRPNCQLRRR